MILKCFLLLAMPLAFTVKGQPHEDRLTPTVCSPNAGCMQGLLVEGYNLPYFEAFLGIPYALPPVGDLRFRSPKEYPKWEGTFNAHEVASDCIQKGYLAPNYPISGSEDCLYLNVYRPMLHPKSRNLPVIIYIYGGGWFSGSASPNIVGPDYFMDTQEVILVTFSYRLGAFGFLSTGDNIMSGNFGLKDQLLAMKWVHNNIAAFGGNANKVTIFGQSVGGIAAHMHMLSPQSQGLFHGVISSSGTANVPFAINETPLAQAISVAALCGIENAEQLSSQQLLAALQQVDQYTLLMAGDGLKFWSVDHLTNYRPVVEPADVEDAFFIRHPNDILKSGDYQPVPFMLGFVPQEGAVRGLAILESQQLRESFNGDFYNILKTFLDFPSYLDEQQIDAKMGQIIKEYFDDEEQLNNKTSQGFLELISERGFHHPLYNTIKDYLNTIDTQIHPIYLYSFNYKGPYSFAELYIGGEPQRDYGVIHCDDLIYLFRSTSIFPDFPKRSPHAKASQLIVENFVHFAKYQKPHYTSRFKKCTKSTFENRPDSICDYQLYENDRSSVAVKSANKFNIRRMKFWDEILTNTNN